MCPGKLGWFRHIHLRQNLQILQSTIAVLKIVRYRMQNKEKQQKYTKQLIIIIIISTEILRNRLAIFFINSFSMDKNKAQKQLIGLNIDQCMYVYMVGVI